jgi:8-amino-7-oxononanoate synthase
LSEELARKFILHKGLSDTDIGDIEELQDNLHKGKSWIDAKHTTADYTSFDNHPGYIILQKRKAEALKRNISIPFFLTNDIANSSNAVINGRQYVNFSGYNYLGLSGHPEVSSAAKDAIDRFGTSVSASRIVSGQISLHVELEKIIADFLGVEDCLVFVSGYNTNVTTLGHLFGRKDLVIHDDLAHNSILTGCHLTNASRMSFPRNDWSKLEELLSEHRANYQRVIIVIEGTYSMDGNIPDLLKAIELKKRFDAMLMVDEAHSLGVIGKTGRGIGEHFSVDRRDVDIWMGSLSKSFASCGGFIAGSKSLIEYLKFSAPGFIFSVGLSPPDTAAAMAAFLVIQKEPERIIRLRHNTEKFLSLAHKAGLDTGMNNGAPIIPILVGDDMLCMQLSRRLFDLGIHVQPIIYPAVMHNDAKLRFFITAEHTEDQIAFTVENLAREFSALI